ncbi:hypothetical protein ACS0TY_016264 [Phlomoides rotata]
MGKRKTILIEDYRSNCMASHLILKRFFLKVSQLLQFFLCVCWHLREFSASLVFPIEASFKDDFCELSSRLVSYLHFLN